VQHALSVFFHRGRSKLDYLDGTGYKFDVADLPPVIGRYERNPVIILVTGRTAVARVGGLTSVGRNVATARRLGLEPSILFPSRMPALGAEIAGEVPTDVSCIPSDSFANQLGNDNDFVLVIAGDWFIAPPAIMAFSEETRGAAVAKFKEQDRTVAPLARMTVGQVRSLIDKLANHPTGELILKAADSHSIVVPLSVRERHRLSDSVAIQRCEEKLFAMLGTRAEPPHVRLVERHVAIPVARLLARSPVTPFHIAMLQIALTILAARLFLIGGFAMGIVGAVIFALSRIAESVATDLARAAVREGVNDRPIIVALDIFGQIAIIWAIALSIDLIDYGALLAVVATAGLIASTWLTIRRILRPVWHARATRTRHSIAPDNFPTRFLRRHGAAWGLLLAALVGRLDLFLWAAALGSHLFYLMWLRVDSRSAARHI
jgi:hypothetical protein